MPTHPASAWRTIDVLCEAIFHRATGRRPNHPLAATDKIDKIDKQKLSAEFG